MNRLTRMLFLGVMFAPVFLPQSACACAACFGRSDSKLAQGMNMGILSLLLVVMFVLGGFAAFFVFLARRAAAAAATARPATGQLSQATK